MRRDLEMKFLEMRRLEMRRLEMRRLNIGCLQRRRLGVSGQGARFVAGGGLEPGRPATAYLLVTSRYPPPGGPL
jgi:hypothetical protein